MTLSIVGFRNFDDTFKSAYLGGTALLNADSVRFYIRGGGELVALKRISLESISVSIPNFSDMKQNEVTEKFIAARESLEKEMEDFQIRVGDEFIFDLGTKLIVPRDDHAFISWIPTWNLGKAVFIILDNNGEPSPYVYHFSDKTDRGLNTAHAFIIAKLQLETPRDGKWTQTGKQLLCYLLAKDLGRRVDFTSAYGEWSSTDFDFSFELKKKPYIGSEHFSPRVAELAAKVAPKLKKSQEGKTQEKPSTPVTTLAVRESTTIGLSDALHVGIDNMLQTMKGAIVLEIDMEHNIYKSVVIDCNLKLCLVTLQPGIERTEEALIEALGTQWVTLE